MKNSHTPKSPKPSFWRGEICKRCYRRNTVGYNLPEDLWEKIVKKRWTILCLTCLDEEAEIQGVEYRLPEKVYPGTWNMWKD